MSLQQMREIDIRTVDPKKLVGIGSVSVDMDLPKQRRMIDTVKQMGGNPYFFISRSNIVVKISHVNTPVTLDERMESYLRTL
jgi:hypothetical protein